MNTQNLEGATYLVGFILPPFIDVVNKRVASGKVRFGISLFVCLLSAIAITYPSLALGDVNSLLLALTVVFSEAQVVYNLYWKDSEARAKLQAKMVAEPQVVSPVEEVAQDGQPQ